MKTDRLEFVICPDLHAMNDMGFANEERRAQGHTYSRARTYNAECYAKVCHQNGKCLIAKVSPLPSLVGRKEAGEHER